MLVLGAFLAVQVADRADAQLSRCDRHRVDSRDRATIVTGDGASTLVVGDSWSVGLGLTDLSRSWPSRLPGEVHVAGFSGSGFGAGASRCRGASFAERAPRALSTGALRADPPDLVVVEGGLNDWDQTDAAVEQGFASLMRTFGAIPVVVVGPASAPQRGDLVSRVDLLLARLCDAYAVPYVATSDLELPYLDDGLHLTETGHEEFGQAVAERISVVQPARPRVLVP